MTEMPKHVRTTIKYDGFALTGHEMDVQDLAPALLALADVIQAANRRFNGNHADIKVLVNADVEQRCFMIDISLVQSLLDQAKTFLGSDHVRTAKEIAEWVGILGGGGVGLFQFLKLIGETKEAGSPLKIANSGDRSIIITGNGNKIIIPNEVYILANDARVVQKAKDVLKPLKKDGYETLAFLNDDREVFDVTKEEAENISSLPQNPLNDLPTESKSEIRGQVRIKSAQYEGNAQWGLLWNGRHISAEMTDEASDWVTAFQDNRVSAPPNSILDVKMVERVQLDADGLAVGKPTYAITQVLSVTPPPKQADLFSET